MRNEIFRQGRDRHYRRLVEAITDYAIYMLDVDGTVISWNAGAERFKGYTAAEILGQNFSRFFTAEDQLAGLPARALATAREQGRFLDEGWRVRNDGSRFWASAVLDAICDDHGKLTGFAKITRDITEKHQLEVARKQLHQAQKMEAVGQLTGGVAHDFNNLLSAVTGCLELMLSGNLDARQRRLIETARRAADRGAKLTDQLLAFSRRQLLRPEPSNINTLIMAFEALIARACGEKIALEFTLATAQPPVNIDQAQFQSALLNLVINARDAMPRGGLIKVRTQIVTLTEREAQRLTEIEAGEYVLVTVEDDGTGMTPETLGHAVEPFFTTKDVGQGSGLGLSQVYGFARQSGGQLEIVSALGSGTKVSLYLPTMSNHAITAPDALLPEAVENRGNVLVVEDDPDVLEIAIEAMRGFGYHVHYARDAHSALTILDNEPSIDLLFTDVVMPHGINGVELACNARRLRPEMRVLLSSGYPRASLQDHEGLRDNMAFIAKPYSLAVLDEKLRALNGGPTLTLAH